MTKASEIADELERLCCAETEGKFFDYVTESIGTICRLLRERDEAAVEVQRLQDLAYAPDGAEYRSMVFKEAAKRLPLIEENDRLKDLLMRAGPAVERVWSLEPGGPRKSRALSLLNAIRKALPAVVDA